MSSTPGRRKSSRLNGPHDDPDAIHTARQTKTAPVASATTSGGSISTLRLTDPPNNAVSGNEYLAAVVSSSLNLPNFWLERPHTWFNMCESTFAVRNITSPLTKYHHCVGKLPQETVASIEDVVNHFAAFNDPYEELKQRICRAYVRTEQQKVNDLLDLPPLSVEKPSILMDNILSLWPDTSTKMTSKLLLGMFLHRLPEQMHAQLDNYNTTLPGDLAAAADAIWAQYGGKFPTAAPAEVTVAAAMADSQRGRSVSPRHANNTGGNRGRSRHHQDGGKGGTSSRNQTPGG